MKPMWYAIYTKAKQEDSVAGRLRDIGIDVLNPGLRLKKYRKNRYSEVVEPLFPCYLFAHFEVERYSHLISYTRGVRYIVGKRHPIVVHDEVVATITAGMDENGVISMSPAKFMKGEPVLIKEGPFKDLRAVFEMELRGSERVLILLNALNCTVELDACFLAVA